MLNLKRIRKRIRSVSSTQQITRVMEMISASKLARVQNLLAQARPYTEFIEGLLHRVVAGLPDDFYARSEASVFFKHPGSGAKRCLVVVTSDRGLCGAYNTNIISMAEKTLDGDRDGWRLVCVGKKAFTYFTKRGWEIASHLVDTGGKINNEQVKSIAEFLASGFLHGEFRDVQVVYTAFYSAGRHKPAVLPFIPLAPAQVPPVDYIFEPDVPSVLEKLVPDYLLARLGILLLESLASEHAARMNAMHNATENADEMIRSLTLQMNKARQAAITKEISEIVSGAEAIKAQ